MKATVRLGTIRGMHVGVHWSVLAIWGLLTWSLAVTLLPEEAPGQGTVAYWLAAGTGAVVLLGCLLAHELSHALAAGRSGVPTESITLWALGGVAALGKEPPTPRSAFAISIVGPLTSVGLGVLFAVMAAATDAGGLGSLPVATLQWLALVNLILAVFNLLPGLPLDGGRVLHAVLWWRSGDRARATQQAGTAGRVVGYALVGVGALEVLAGWWQGLWTMLIGWFLVDAARQEQQAAMAPAPVVGMRVRDAMTARPDVVRGDLTVDRLLEEMLRLGHVSFPVVDDHDRLVGLVTMRAIQRVRPERRATTTVAEITTPLDVVPVAGPDDLLAPVAARAGERGRTLVLLGDGNGRRELVGILSSSDVVRAVQSRTRA